MPTVDELNSRFAIANTLEFCAGNGGLIKAVVTTPAAAAEVYLHGAHVTHYQPTDQSPVLFLSGKSRFEAGKAIRGGVPICFPWFGNLEGHPDAPAHGLARTSQWSVERTRQNPGGSVSIEFTLNSHDSDATWPHAFIASYIMTVGAALRLELKIEHKSGEPFFFEEALHSYFSVADVRKVAISGLATTPYLDKMQANREVAEGSEAIRITGETDRVYLDTTSTCEIADPVLKRKIVVKKRGSNSTVLWNPWIAKAKSMTDFGDDEWPAMLCIETCNVGRSAMKLSATESHTMVAEIEAKLIG